MISGYSCLSCGSNLSYIEEKKVFRCEYCGKLFTDEREIIDLKLIEDLRQKKRTDEAKTYVELLLEKDPDDFYLNWEWCNTVYLPGPPSRFISANHKDAKKMSELRRNHDLERLKKTIPADHKRYIDDLEEMNSLWSEIDELTLRLEQLRRQQTHIRNEMARQKIPEDDPLEKISFGFRDIQWYVMLLAGACILVILMLGVNPWAGFATLALIGGIPALIRVIRKRSKDRRVALTGQAKNASLNEAKELEEKISSLKAKVGDIRNDAKAYEDKFFEIITRES